MAEMDFLAAVESSMNKPAKAKKAKMQEQDMEQEPMIQAEPAAPAEAPMQNEAPDGRLMRLFQSVSGAEFDPNSEADMARMSQLRMFLEENPDMADMSDNKIALAFYRKGK